MTRIYITDLEAYNNGHLIGEWYEFPMNTKLLAESVEDVLREGKMICEDEHFHEEYFITDYESDIFKIDEYEDIFKLNEKVKLIDELDEDSKKSIRFLIDNNLVNDFEEALERREDVIIHEEMSMEDIAYEFVTECYNLDELAPIIANNIDYSQIGREIEMDGRHFVEGNTIFEYLG